ncbi:MAG: DUF4965 domain-containing protein, partial [Actinobacteria bacterium]|nr:DUF4965 domain-containing protein [Actinomycetota bacterium]MBU1943869.1 DUF4965 domain-containing protein [Actinomycetota bacterium]MBU2687690.1 DUF4965 domain-containing protein [Actinomycetota bacterium]
MIIQTASRRIPHRGRAALPIAGAILCLSVLMLVSWSAVARAAGQVAVELQQNSPGDRTFATTFGDPIAGTDGVTRQAYKFGRQREGKHFTYVVANLEPWTTYSVELSFVEHDFTSAGSRVFDVFVQSELAVFELDVFAAAGRDAAHQRTLEARTDSKGLLSVEFRSDVAGCADYATVSTIRVYSGGRDVVEIDAASSRNSMNPPVRHYDSGGQDTWEAVLGRLGSRISLDLLPQRLGYRFSTLGTWTGDLTELVVALKSGGQVRSLPFTDRFSAWESIEQSQTMTSQAFDCSSGSTPLDVKAVFRAPFYPGDEKVSCAPFFYIDLTVTNAGERAASGTLLLARPHKEDFVSATLDEYATGDARGLTCRTSYTYQDESLGSAGSRAAEEALAVPAGEAGGVDFRGSTQGEFSDFTTGSLWGWDSPAGFPAVSDDPQHPLFSFYPRGYSGAVWTTGSIPPGGSVTRHFILAGYTGDSILRVENDSYTDGTFRFRYAGTFAGVTEVVDYAAAERTAGDDLAGRSAFFDSTISSDDYLSLDPAYEQSVRDLVACSFQTYLTNTWWARSSTGRDWFSVWEGTWMRFHGTIDVEYNQAWFYYEFWPDLLPTIMDEWLLYPKSNDAGVFLPHDIGILDLVAGQVYEHDMPVEENLNYILMLHRYWKTTGNTAYVKARFSRVRELTRFVMNCDTNGNGLPDRYSQTTFDDGTPALEGGRDQSYLGFKALAAYGAAREMALGISPAEVVFAAECQGRSELINQTLEYDCWLSDHFAVCLDAGVDPADREAYSIHTGNGLLYPMGAQRDRGVTSTNLERLRLDVRNATARTWGPYGSRHTSYDPGRMWISSNIWRDAVAGYIGTTLFGRSPLDLSRSYWEFERYLGKYVFGGYWDGMIYGSGAGERPGRGLDASGGAPMLVPAPVGIVAERPVYFDRDGRTGGHVALGATNPASTFYFAEGSCRPGFDPYLCVQ